MREGRKTSLPEALLPVALRAPFRRASGSENPKRSGVLNYESTYHHLFSSPVSFSIEATRPCPISWSSISTFMCLNYEPLGEREDFKVRILHTRRGDILIVPGASTSLVDDGCPFFARSSDCLFERVEGRDARGRRRQRHLPPTRTLQLHVKTTPPRTAPTSASFPTCDKPEDRRQKNLNPDLLQFAYRLAFGSLFDDV